MRAVAVGLVARRAFAVVALVALCLVFLAEAWMLVWAAVLLAGWPLITGPGVYLGNVVAAVWSVAVLVGTPWLTIRAARRRGLAHASAVLATGVILAAPVALFLVATA
jgi:hypothetical protein